MNPGPHWPHPVHAGTPGPALHRLHHAAVQPSLCTHDLTLLAMGLSLFQAAGLGRLRRLVRHARPASQPEPLRRVDP
jgi:hypothetical protein